MEFGPILKAAVKRFNAFVPGNRRSPHCTIVLTAATKRLVSIKNSVLLSGKPVCLFLDLFFQPVQVYVFSLIDDVRDHGA